MSGKEGLSAGQYRDPILIVGGGPSGIVMAIELCRRGVPCRIIDSKPGPVLTSRAFTIHAKTLEIFENMGIVDQYINTGIKSYGFVFNFKGLDDKPVLDFRILRSRYPYILIYSQCETERLLREHLESTYGRTIEWGHQLTALDQGDGGSIRATIKNLDTNEEETLNPSYVIGADGVHSFVRKSFNLPFEGEAYEGMIMQMMDTEVPGYEEDPEWVQYFMDKDNFLLTTPLPNGKCRLLVSDMGESADRKKESRTEAFQRILDQHDVHGTIDDPEWTTQWVIWKRLADIYHLGSVFLCGDSAHVHSPSGGQGMNSCIQDSWNLAWKLAMVWKGEARPEILDTYEVERKPVAEQVIEGTDAMHEIIMAHGKGLSERMALTQTPNWQIEVTERVAGLSYTYYDLNPLPDGLSVLEGGPRIGDRAPDVELEHAHTLYGHLRRPELTMLVMPAGDDEEAKALIQAVENEYGGVLTAKLVTDEDIERGNEDRIVRDPQNKLPEAYGQGSEGRIYVIRPDGYVGFKCAVSESDKLYDYLGMWFYTAPSASVAAAE